MRTLNSYLRTIAKPPFYACRLRSSMISSTSAGLRIDSKARVLDKADRPMPGLYAAGESTCFMPAYYLAGGGAQADGAIFGRIAGKNSAQALLSR
jgi:fumarate reductase flavoprotein subunit